MLKRRLKARIKALSVSNVNILPKWKTRAQAKTSRVLKMKDIFSRLFSVLQTRKAARGIGENDSNNIILINLCKLRYSSLCTTFSPGDGGEEVALPCFSELKNFAVIFCNFWKFQKIAIFWVEVKKNFAGAGQSSAGLQRGRVDAQPEHGKARFIKIPLALFLKKRVLNPESRTFCPEIAFRGRKSRALSRLGARGK